MQVELVKALCDNEHLHGKLFFVGDYKQSIYRFRGADPTVFRQLRDEIPSAGRMPLSVNFRSRPAILDFVNALFCEELGQDYEPLRSPREEKAAAPAVEFLWANNATEEATAVADQASENASRPSNRRSPLSSLPFRRYGPARAAAANRGRLDRATHPQHARSGRGEEGEKIIWDKDTKTLRAGQAGRFRPAVPRLTNVEYYEEALRRYGIDYYLVGGHAFYSQQEVYDLLNLLRAIDVPGDEVSLLGVLRSPMFALDDETLFWLSRRTARGTEEVAGNASSSKSSRQPPPSLSLRPVVQASCRTSLTTGSGNAPRWPRPRSAICGR